MAPMAEKTTKGVKMKTLFEELVDYRIKVAGMIRREDLVRSKRADLMLAGLDEIIMLLRRIDQRDASTIEALDAAGEAVSDG